MHLFIPVSGQTIILFLTNSHHWLLSQVIKHRTNAHLTLVIKCSSFLHQRQCIYPICFFTQLMKFIRKNYILSSHSTSQIQCSSISTLFKESFFFYLANAFLLISIRKESISICLHVGRTPCFLFIHRLSEFTSLLSLIICLAILTKFRGPAHMLKFG